VFGTAQLGADYGIANQSGRPDAEEATDMLERAWRGGVRILDTAPAYGDSEAVIAGFLERYPECPFAVISKLDPAINLADADAVETAVQESRDRIGRPLEGMLLHNASALPALAVGGGDALQRCIDKGLTAAIGVSVYTPEEFLGAIDEDVIDIIQAPYNALDRRVRDEGLLQRAADAGKRVFLRSAYLQGLLLMEPETLPPAMAFAAPTIADWRKLCADHGLSPLRGALGFVRATAPDAWIVIGCESKTQIDDTLAETEKEQPGGDFLAAVEALRTGDPRVIDPRTWTQ
jgi:aryl-alcohol dehydrogenase-like predicted oxidoreductase